MYHITSLIQALCVVHHRYRHIDIYDCMLGPLLYCIVYLSPLTLRILWNSAHDVMYSALILAAEVILKGISQALFSSLKLRWAFLPGFNIRVSTIACELDHFNEDRLSKSYLAINMQLECIQRFLLSSRKQRTTTHRLFVLASEFSLCTIKGRPFAMTPRDPRELALCQSITLALTSQVCS